MNRLRLFSVVGLLLLSAIPLAAGTAAERTGLPGLNGSAAPAVGRQSRLGPGQGLPAAAGWTSESVEASRLVGGMDNRALAVDAQGRPHLAYGITMLHYAWFDGTAWQHEVVDPSTDLAGISLALDAAGRPHISYCQMVWGGYTSRWCDALKYAFYDGLTWQVETVDGGIGPADYGPGTTSLALDAAGRPHITYYHIGNSAVQYAYFDGTIWQIETVVSPVGPYTAYTSLALDAAGQPHVGYHARLDGEIQHLYRDGPTWQVEIVDSGELVGIGTQADVSLAVDGTGRLQVGYLYWVDYSHPEARYAYRDGTGWHVTVVGSATWTSWDVGLSLALDGAGRPSLAYRDGDLLRYARYDGTAWQRQDVDSGWEGDAVSLALDAAGRPHIAYGVNTIRYAYDDGSAWQRQVVDVGARLWGGVPSLAFDLEDRPHISYCTNGSGADTLKYASYDGAAWQVESAVSGLPSSGCAGASLALDAAGRPHIAFANRSSNDLVYAYHDGQAWQIETVDHLSSVGYELALVLDSSGLPHIAYEDFDGFSLKYAHWDGTAWLTETVPTSPVGYHVSLALDAAGRPHVSYTGHYGQGLRYAYYDGNGWQRQDVDSGWEGNAVSLALDAAGRPHIGYADCRGSLSCEGIKYAHDDGTGWQTETVASGSFGLYTSLALDTAGRPHIGYLEGVYWGDSGCTSGCTVRYAYHDGSAWYFEAVDPAAPGFGCTSLSLDHANQVGIGYVSSDHNSELRYAQRGCEPFTGVQLAGPGSLPIGITGSYTVTFAPLTATLPLFAWDNGAQGNTAAYHWTQPGDYTVTVTATSPCTAQVRLALPVHVFCQPVAELTIQGPLSVPLGIAMPYDAAYLPVTVSLPLTLTWDNGTIGTPAVYSWTAVGPYTVSVTATNCGGSLRQDQAVTVFCQPVAEVAIAGPLATLVGLPTSYQAAVDPITASRPLTLTWDNGSVGPSASYSWPATGTYTLTVTATNACGQAQAGLAVRVLEEWPYYLYIPRFCKQYVPGVCVPVSAAAISGPAQLVVGEEGFYAATFSPPNASWPLELAWDNGSVGPTTAYSWTQPGLYTLTVTATNPCGEAVAALSVSVTAPACRPVATAAITGPVTLVVGELALYTATVSPPTATLPLTMTWDNGSMGPTAAYSWSLPGIYTVTVIATNACGAASGTLAGTVTVPVSAQQAQLSRRLLPFSIAASFDMVFTHHVSLLTVRVSRCTRHPLRFTLYSSLVTQHALSLVT